MFPSVSAPDTKLQNSYQVVNADFSLFMIDMSSKARVCKDYPAVPACPEAPEDPQDPDIPEDPKDPQAPEDPKDPEAPEDPMVPEAPVNPKDPENAVDHLYLPRARRVPVIIKNDFHFCLIRRAFLCISLMKDVSYFYELVTQHLS